MIVSSNTTRLAVYFNRLSRSLRATLVMVVLFITTYGLAWIYFTFPLFIQWLKVCGGFVAAYTVIYGLLPSRKNDEL